MHGGGAAGRRRRMVAPVADGNNPLITSHLSTQDLTKDGDFKKENEKVTVTLHSYITYCTMVSQILKKFCNFRVEIRNCNL